MSFLENLKKKREVLKPTETKITQCDGRKFLENKFGTKEIQDEKSHGYVIDTKPDLIPALIISQNKSNLFLGSQDSVNIENILNLKITHILSIGIETPDVGANFEPITIFLPCLDLPETDLESVFNLAIKFIKKSLCHGNVLVHCNAGVSRSASIVIGYLIIELNLSYDESYKLVKSKRPCIQPNSGFVKFLKNLDNIKYLKN